MAESKVNPDNYILVQGWMVSDLGLKGNELLIYACIYGFTQAENQTFSGSTQYLADWTNSTKRGVYKNLKSLVEKGYLLKFEKVINGVKFCEYQATKFTGGGEQSSSGGGEQSSPNNIDIDNIDKYNSNIYSLVVAYLNEKTGSNYKATTKATKEKINARLKEGNTLDDFKMVIDKKVAQWKGTEMEEYLRPETLFGTKFESYLNAKITTKGRVTYGTNQQASRRTENKETYSALAGTVL